eukprot:s4095_g5.t1
MLTGRHSKGAWRWCNVEFWVLARRQGFERSLSEHLRPMPQARLHLGDGARIDGCSPTLGRFLKVKCSSNLKP